MDGWGDVCVDWRRKKRRTYIVAWGFFVECLAQIILCKSCIETGEKSVGENEYVIGWKVWK